MVFRTAGEGQSDAWLMKRLARGQTEVLGELYLRYGNAVLRLIAHSLGGSRKEDAEDLTQEVFLTVSRTAGRYEEKGMTKSWIFRIALNAVRDFRKKSAVRGRLMKQYSEERRATLSLVSSTDVTSSQMRQRVEQAMAALSEEQRDVLMLAASEGMSGREISETLGISHNAVRTRLHRARTALLSALKIETHERQGAKR